MTQKHNYEAALEAAVDSFNGYKFLSQDAERHIAAIRHALKLAHKLEQEPSEEIKIILIDEETPYLLRRNKSYDDGLIYEVIRQDNEDWRERITDNMTVLARFACDDEADAFLDSVVADYMLKAMIEQAKKEIE